MPANSLSSVVHIARRNGLDLSPAQESRLARYVKQLLMWNDKINLISRKDVANVWEGHILHSLSILFGRAVSSGMHVLDLGSGGGLPGIPFAIARPDSSVVLLDSTGKKIRAVEEMLVSVNLENVSAICGRAEEIAKSKEFSGAFDIVLARGVASLVDVIRWSKPFLRAPVSAVRSGLTSDDAGGNIVSPCILCMKGGDLDKEVHEAELKVRPARILVLSLLFRDGVPDLLQGKKLVLVRP